MLNLSLKSVLLSGTILFSALSFAGCTHDEKDQANNEDEDEEIVVVVS